MPDVGQIYSLIPKVSLEIGAVAKDGRNQQQGYSFRGIEHLMNAAHLPMMLAGIFCTTEVTDWRQEERASTANKALFYTSLRMKVTFYAPDGSSVSTTTVGEAMDSADKSSNKAMSAAFKYALFQTFMIPTEVEDADLVTHEVTPQRQVPQNGKAPASRPAGPPPKDDPARVEFCHWIDPYVKNGSISEQAVVDAVKRNNYNYPAAGKELVLEMQPRPTN